MERNEIQEEFKKNSAILGFKNKETNARVAYLSWAHSRYCKWYTISGYGPHFFTRRYCMLGVEQKQKQAQVRWFLTRGRASNCAGSLLAVSVHVVLHFTTVSLSTREGQRFLLWYFLETFWAAAWQNQQNDLCAQQRLRSAWASAQPDQSSLSAWRSIGSWASHSAYSEDSDQTGRTPMLIWVRWRTCHFIGFVMLRLFSLFSYKCVSFAAIHFVQNYLLLWKSLN